MPLRNRGRAKAKDPEAEDKDPKAKGPKAKAKGPKAKAKGPKAKAKAKAKAKGPKLQFTSVKMAFKQLLVQEGRAKDEISDQLEPLVQALSMALRRASLAFLLYLQLCAEENLH